MPIPDVYEVREVDDGSNGRLKAEQAAIGHFARVTANCPPVTPVSWPGGAVCMPDRRGHTQHSLSNCLSLCAQ